MQPDYEKIIQAINYFARKSVHNRISKLYFLKLIYLADRYHLRKYGRMITNDTYFAMKYGPVASASKKAFEFIELPEHYLAYADTYLCTSQSTDNYLHSIKSVDMDIFSESDIEAMEAAWYIKKEHSDLVAFTHLFPEWKKHEAKLKLRSVCPMDISDFFSKTNDSVEYCPADEELVELNRQHFAMLCNW